MRPHSRRTTSTLMAGVVTGMHNVAAHPCAMAPPSASSTLKPGSSRQGSDEVINIYLSMISMCPCPP